MATSTKRPLEALFPTRPGLSLPPRPTTSPLSVPPTQPPATREGSPVSDHGQPSSAIKTSLPASPMDLDSPQVQQANMTTSITSGARANLTSNVNTSNGPFRHIHSISAPSKDLSRIAYPFGHTFTPLSSNAPCQASRTQMVFAGNEEEGGFKCRGGEVLIKSGRGFAWQMSEINFRKASNQFAALLDSGIVEPIRLTKKDMEEGKCIRWVVEMVPNERLPSDLRLRTLRLVDAVSKVKGGHTLPDLETLEPDAKILWHDSYDAFFRIICEKTESMQGGPLSTLENNSSKDKRFIAATTSILAVAEEHGATAAVRNFIEQNLLRMTPRLWFYIAAHPHVWLVLAGRIKSGNMFREAMCHVVGKIDAKQFVDRTYFERKSKLHDDILKLVIEKAEELLALKKQIEFKITGFYPLRMYHPADEGYVPDRGVYTADIYLYQTRALVMQYIAGAYAMGFHHQHCDGGIRFYQTLRTGGNAYLSKDKLANFNARFAMSTRALDPFLAALNVMKDEIKPELDPLFKDETQAAKNVDAKLGYLTCTTVNDEELPWSVAVEAEIDDDAY